LDLYLGCSGWSYDAWVGPFYPSGAKQSDFLRLYSRVFNAVEIDSTFYRLPGKDMVRNWTRATPDEFIFTAKMPKQVTHDNRLEQFDKILQTFLSSMRLLGKKLGCILVQLPPSFSYEDSWKVFKDFVSVLPSDLEFAVEFRSQDWFKDEVYSFLKDRKMTLVWSEIPYAESPSVLTTDAAYLRLVGDRSIGEEQFGKVVKERSADVAKWAKMLKQSQPNRVFAFSNNHFQGFAPATVNLLRRELGLDPVDWQKEISSYKSPGQLSLFD
jgi:uncharacterized protein YecE (DUF72 family)